jgi:ParB-like chromosome segregation protein Spo0J
MPDGSFVPNLAARFHPLCDLFPAMEGKEFSALVLDIRMRGQQVPIMKMGDLILDGRHRFLACKEAGVEPRY